MTTHSKLSKGTLLTLTPFYMIGQGLVLGLLAGLLFGTYIVPLIGSLYGAGIGAVAGVVTGGILGIIYIILLGLMGIEGVLRSRIWLVPLS
ncbi:MAG: hypothetical protein KC615_16330, partial [Anaerolineae bacterium]|nr:hypothetical protein [Anaerolineae bacterium]